MVSHELSYWDAPMMTKDTEAVVPPATCNNIAHKNIATAHNAALLVRPPPEPSNPGSLTPDGELFSAKLPTSRVIVAVRLEEMVRKKMEASAKVELCQKSPRPNLLDQAQLIDETWVVQEERKK